MKLLSQKQIRVKRQSETVEKARIGVKVSQEVDKLTKQLNNLKAFYITQSREVKENLSKEVEGLLRDIKLLEAELEFLKIEREELGKPLDAKWDELRLQEQELERQRTQLKQQAQEVSHSQQKLSEFELILREKEKDLDSRETEVSKQFKVLFDTRDSTDKKLVELAESAMKLEGKWDILNNQQSNREEELLNRQANLEVKEVYLKEREESLNQQEKLLVSRRMALEAASRELND